MESSGYCEVLVKVQASKREQMILTVLRVLTFVFLALSVLFLFVGMFHLLFWPLTLAFLIAWRVWKRKLSVEYEYQYLDGSLRIDRIIAMKKRKKVGRYDLENLYLMAPEGDERLAGYEKQEGMKRVDCSSRVPDGERRYQLAFPHELLTLEPTEEMVRLMWRAAPTKVVRKKALVQ